MNIRTPKLRTVKLLSPDGKAVNVTNFSRFAIDNGINRAMLSMVINSRREHVRGWRLASYRQ